jgi:hypothetical protein
LNKVTPKHTLKDPQGHTKSLSEFNIIIGVTVIRVMHAVVIISYLTFALEQMPIHSPLPQGTKITQLTAVLKQRISDKWLHAFLTKSHCMNMLAHRLAWTVSVYLSGFMASILQYYLTLPNQPSAIIILPSTAP